MSDGRSGDEVLAESVLSVARGYLGGAEALRSLGVGLLPSERRVIVWVEPRREDLASELQLVSAFFEVQACFEDELELELRFGDMARSAEAAAASTSLVLSR